jgi:hypothetical protein
MLYKGEDQIVVEASCLDGILIQKVIAKGFY